MAKHFGKRSAYKPRPSATLNRQPNHEQIAQPDLERDLALMMSGLPRSSNPALAQHSIDRLQKTIGNQAVQRLLADQTRQADSQISRKDAPDSMIQRGIMDYLNPLGGILNPANIGIAQVFHTMEAASLATSSRINIPSGWNERLKEYGNENPSDAGWLLVGMSRLSGFHKGGAILKLQSGAAAMTLDTNVFVADISSELNLATYAHELVHVTQYMMGVGNFLASYFGLSLATIIKRFLMNEPIDMMESSPHESQAYEMEKRFNDWHKAKHGKYASEIKA